MVYQIVYEETEKGRRKVALLIKNREALMALRQSAENVGHLEQARQGDTAAKRQLVQIAYNLGYVEHELAGCKSIGSYFFHDVDCYDAAQSEATRELILCKREEIGLVMLERSASGGWHLVCRRTAGTTILENQVRVATILRLEMDTSAHDLQRVVFSTSASAQDLPYLDDCIFTEPMSTSECEAEYARLKERERQRQEQVPPGAKKANKHYRPWEEKEDARPEAGVKRSEMSDTRVFPTEYHGIAYTAILRKYWQMYNHGYEPSEGDRDSLTYQLACDLRGICGQNAEWMDQVIPCYDGFTPEEKRRKISSALNSPYEGVSTRIRTVVEALMGQRQQDTPPAPEPSRAETGYCELAQMLAAPEPPALPKQLPQLVRVVTQHTPPVYKAAVAQAMFPPLATYPKKLAFMYNDRQVRELRINCLIVADTGSGKDNCTRQPLAHLLADMKQRDEENRRRLKRYNEVCNAKSDNKQRPMRPDNLIIQTLKSDITKAALIQRMDEADSAPLYVRMSELEQWDDVEGAKGSRNQFTIMKMADDEGNDFGSDRASTQSVIGSGCLHLNWNANTTTPKALHYFRFVVTDGPISRLTLATIPSRLITFDFPTYGDYDAQYDAELKPYIDNLKAATGTIDCAQARRMVKRLKVECAEYASLTEDMVFENLTHRGLVAAFRKACLLYAANGMQWERTIEPFCRWSLYYDLYLKMQLWGEQIRRADSEIPEAKRGPQNLLDLLPDDFTIEQVRSLRVSKGKSDANGQTVNMVSTWKKRHYVVQMADGSFKKSEKYLSKLRTKI